MRLKIISYCWLITFIIFFQNNTFAQFYEKGQDPGYLRWKQINTSNFQIIFPESYEKQAQRLTNILEYAYDYATYSLHNIPKKISVIVHNYSIHNNGFVAWAPKRIELYPTPGQDSYPEDPLKQLALHELRHVVQVDKLNQGITKIFSYLLGEQASGGITGFIPFWYLEGDAVASETSLSMAGRGRLPSFEMKLRALLLEKGKVFSYDKSLLGSYNDYVPNYYEYGYQMVAFSRKKYGSQLWNNTLNDIGKKPFTLNPLHFSLYKQTGLSKKKLYDNTFSELNTLWKKQADELNYTTYQKVNKKKKKVFTSYRFPQYLNDSVFIAEKSGIAQIREFVAIQPNGKEIKIHTPGFYNPVRLSVAQNKIVWAERIPDSRWDNRYYSVIKIFDVSTGIEKSITKKTRYFAPVFSRDGLLIATVEVTPENEVSLIILNAENGKIIQKLKSPGNKLIQMPSWTENDENIISIFIDNKGKGIWNVNLPSGRWELLMEPDYLDKLNVMPFQHYIFYHSTYSGIDNIYALDIKTGQKYQVTSSKFGAFDITVSPNGEKIAVSDYSSYGYNLVEIDINPDKWIPINSVKNNSVKYYEDLVKQEKGPVLTQNIPNKIFKVKSYRKWQNVFQFHSWAPFYFDYFNFDLENIQIHPGLTLLSQNQLSTAITSLGYAYKNNQHHLITKFIYKGWYPVFEISSDYGGIPSVYPDTIEVDVSKKFNFNTRIYFPVNLTCNRFIRGLHPSINTEYTNSYIFNEERQVFEKGRWLINYRIYFYNYLKMSDRDILPKWGQTFDIRFGNSPTDRVNYGSKYSLCTTLYFPGLFNNHCLKIKAAIEKQKPERFIYFNSLDFPRGYYNRISEELQTFSAEYVLPLFYPDFNFSWLTYIKRFRGSFYYDHAFGERNYNLISKSYSENPEVFNSLGAEFITDFYILRIPFPISLGIRYFYKPKTNTYNIETFFNVDIFGFNINR
jgi:hypothetical protein